MGAQMKDTDQEVLEWAIGKAIEGGWKPKVPEGCNAKTLKVQGCSFTWKPDYLYYRKLNKGRDIGELELPPNRSGYVKDPYRVIFNHDFAKALWGEKPLHWGWHKGKYNWEYHLQMMVIHPNPIDYLREYKERQK